MRILDSIKNNFLYGDKYKTHSEAIIISCYFNPQNNPFRLKAFNVFYDSIKHLNHKVIECVIGDSEPQLPVNDNITRVYTQNLLWHKESLLNKLIKDLDPKYKYIFWVDADVIFTNKNWLVDSVNQLRFTNIVQPFEYCIHLEKDEQPSDFPIGHFRNMTSNPVLKHSRMWKSFCANYVTDRLAANSEIYDVHGHVGFAWGARRKVLDLCPLYDRALVGGADHIMAHAAAGHIPHKCITKSFTEDIEAINNWSRKFYSIVGGSIGYTKGDLFHMWHGDLKDRKYLKRIQEFTGTSKNIVARDSNGLHVTHDDSYVRNYFNEREVKDDSGDFLTSMAIGYATDNAVIGRMVGGNMTGAIIGEMLNDSNDSHHHNHNNNINNDNFS